MQTKSSLSENLMSQSQILKDSKINPKEIKVKCCNREALDMCINENCKKQFIFTCGNFNCECQKQHGLCPKVNLHSIVTSIQRKVIPAQGIKNFIDLKIENIINELSKLRQKLLEQLPNKMKYSRLHQIEKRFLEHAYSFEENKKQFKTKDSVLLWRLASIKNQNNIFTKVKKFITNFQNISLKSVQSFTSQLNQLFQNQKNKKQLHLKKLQQQNIKTLTIQSSIIKSIQHAVRLVDFFKEPIKRITLLYKASDHQFNMSKFYETCGDATDTVILCQSNKGRIVGGYTPLCYNQENLKKDKKSIADYSGKSFMFSLTNNDKFIYKDKESCAIIRRKDKSQICFGSAQILIYDKSNLNNQCHLYFNSSYHNQKYNIDDKDAFIKFNGSQSWACRINQWQVWKVEM